jgi:peroxiredoxin
MTFSHGRRIGLRWFLLLVPMLLVLAITGPLHAGDDKAPTESSLSKRISKLRSLPDDKRGAEDAAIAHDISTLPAGPQKVELAVRLTHLATEGDPGADNLQQVATTLGNALSETPIPADKDGNPAKPYLALAQLVRYEGTKTELKDPELIRALKILIADDAEVQKADFTLENLDGKKVTLSGLRGKIVLLNFWATECLSCGKEMSNLDLIYTHYKPQGLEFLGITQESAAPVVPFIRKGNYSYPILLDPGNVVGREFHVEDVPRTYVFNREGKLVAEAINMRTQRQFFGMLMAAGLHPQ